MGRPPMGRELGPRLITPLPITRLEMGNGYPIWVDPWAVAMPNLSYIFCEYRGS